LLPGRLFCLCAGSGQERQSAHLSNTATIASDPAEVQAATAALKKIKPCQTLTWHMADKIRIDGIAAFFFEMKIICTVKRRQLAWMCRIWLQIISEPS
jgi:hypothetical protein